MSFSEVVHLNLYETDDKIKQHQFVRLAVVVRIIYILTDFLFNET
jgi:hypothetical protein